MSKNKKGMKAIYDAKHFAEEFCRHGDKGITQEVYFTYARIKSYAIYADNTRMDKLKFSRWSITYDELFRYTMQLGYLASEVRVGM